MGSKVRHDSGPDVQLISEDDGPQPQPAAKRQKTSDAASVAPVSVEAASAVKRPGPRDPATLVSDMRSQSDDVKIISSVSLRQVEYREVEKRARAGDTKQPRKRTRRRRGSVDSHTLADPPKGSSGVPDRHHDPPRSRDSSPDALNGDGGGDRAGSSIVRTANTAPWTQATFQVCQPLQPRSSDTARPSGDNSDVHDHAQVHGDSRAHSHPQNHSNDLAEPRPADPSRSTNSSHSDSRRAASRRAEEPDEADQVDLEGKVSIEAAVSGQYFVIRDPLNDLHFLMGAAGAAGGVQASLHIPPVIDENSPGGLGWLQLNVKNVQRVSSSPDCAVIKIYRPACIPGAGILFIRLDSTAEAHQLACWIQAGSACKWQSNHAPHMLEKQFSHAMKLAKENEYNNPRPGCAAASQPSQTCPPDPSTPIVPWRAAEAIKPSESGAIVVAEQGGRTPSPVPLRRSARNLRGTARIVYSATSLGRRRPRVSAQKAPDLWSAENPEWQTAWGEGSLLYPTVGMGRETVEKTDILRLDEGLFLNDNIINFYLRFIYNRHTAPSVSERVHIMNSFWYNTLSAVPENDGVNYSVVKKWTAKIDVFAYDYVIVPMNEHVHWWIAVICNPATLLSLGRRKADPDRDNGSGNDASSPIAIDASADEPDTEDTPESGAAVVDKTTPLPRRAPDTRPDHPPEEQQFTTNGTSGREGGGVVRSAAAAKAAAETISDDSRPDVERHKPFKVFTLDSLKLDHSDAAHKLHEFLVAEAESRKEVEVDLADIPAARAVMDIPGQNNFCDCGLFLLSYVRQFVMDPDGSAQAFMQKKRPKWKVNGPELRAEIRTEVFRLKREMDKNNALKRRERRKSPKRKRSTAESADALPLSLPAPPAPPSPSPSQTAKKARAEKDDKGSDLSYVSGVPNTRVAARCESYSASLSSLCHVNPPAAAVRATILTPTSGGKETEEAAHSPKSVYPLGYDSLRDGGRQPLRRATVPAVDDAAPSIIYDQSPVRSKFFQVGRKKQMKGIADILFREPSKWEWQDGGGVGAGRGGGEAKGVL